MSSLPMSCFPGEVSGIDLCSAPIERYPEVVLPLISPHLASDFQNYPLRAVCLHKPFGLSDLSEAIAGARVPVSCMIEGHTAERLLVGVSGI